MVRIGMGTLERLHANREEILRLAALYGAGNIRVFGSVVRGEDSEGSDVDFLVVWDARASLSDWVGFQQEVARVLGAPVDVVSENSLHWYIRDKVLAEARPLP